MIKAVIFDMDGLMIDSERVTFDGYVLECGKLGKTIDEAFYRKLLGLPVPSIYQTFRDEFGSSFPIEEIMKTVHGYVKQVFEEKGVPLKPGLTELLKYLKSHGYKTIVATSSTRDRVDRILDSSGLTEYYDDSICGNEVQKGKPDPEIFLKACEKLGVKPSEAIVLEDSETGILAASSAAIPVICVPDMKYPEKEFAEKTAVIADSLNDVLSMFEEGEI